VADTLGVTASDRKDAAILSPPRTDEPGHGGDRLPWIRRYVFSTDHKWIGIQYAVTALCFLLIGFSLMLLMRLQLGWPSRAFGVLKILGEGRAPGGVLLPEGYNQLGAMHGTIMVFLAIVPLAVGAFGNYLVPLQIGAPDMAFPKLNMASYWCYVVGGLIMLATFALPSGTAASGWTSYAPLSVIAAEGQTWWLAGMVFLITSSLLGSVNFLVTIIQLRTTGMTFMRLPFFIWTQLVTSFLLLLAFPPLEAAAVLQLMDRVAGTSFFLPSGLVITGEPLNVAGGGNPLLWQHLFWFLGHPEVYVLILPAMGIVAEVIANNTRRPLWGYRWLVGAAVSLGIMSFMVWAHHMFLTGMGTLISSFFQTTTMIISIPSVIILTIFFTTLWGGSIRFTTPMLFALAFLPMFGIGGLTGLPLGLATTGLHLHDTYYVIGHFHYIVAPGTIFAMFAGIYYWFPKVTGRKLNDVLGKIHFWASLVFINGVFFPMFIQGLAGVSRRLYDGGLQYEHAREVASRTNPWMSVSAWCLLVAQLPFLVNFFWNVAAAARGVKNVDANPWKATTLEWAATTSPPLAHGNFATLPIVRRGPYEYSTAECTGADFLPQHALSGEAPPPSGGLTESRAVAMREP
jgi:cytochrome c oxidase subunit 1